MVQLSTGSPVGPYSTGKRAGRWVEIFKTTNSGKTLFVCVYCGRTSPTPDISCPATVWDSEYIERTYPQHGTCEEMERRENEHFKQLSPWQFMGRASSVGQLVLDDPGNAAKTIQEDRLRMVRYFESLIGVSPASHRFLADTLQGHINMLLNELQNK